tara:strand:- start:113 stop:343 length:231 start_codon:yes stop_codon:yes gene_type:complete
MAKFHILPVGTHKPLGSSWIKEVPNDIDVTEPIVYRFGQSKAMADTYARTIRKNRWDELRQLAKQMKSNVGRNNGE